MTTKEKAPPASVRFNVAGVTIGNRQALLRQLNESAGVRLVREPQNPTDSNAIQAQARTARGFALIGYVPADVAAWMSPAIERGHSYSASIFDLHEFETDDGRQIVACSLDAVRTSPPRLQQTVATDDIPSVSSQFDFAGNSEFQLATTTGIANRLRDQELKAAKTPDAVFIGRLVFAIPLLAIAGYFTFQYSASIGADLRAAAETAELERVTLPESEAIQMGWSLERVENLLGRPGVETSVSQMDLPYVGSVKTVGLIWHNKDGSSLQLVFQNDKVVFKNQLLLKP